MYHSITFERADGSMRNTWDNWFLIPSSRPKFSPPTPNFNYVDIPGGSPLDLSESLTGNITYGNRIGSHEFIVDNGHYDWNVLYSNIMDFMHGIKLKAYLEDDPYYYYEGRFSINDWKSEPHNSKIVIDYNVAPYKMEKYSSLEYWKWDDFNFEEGVIRDYRDLVVDGTLSVTIPGRRMPMIPIFIVEDGELELSFEGNTYDLVVGTSRVPNVVLTEGENVLTFTGNGTVSINYRGGRL